jgi:hypothetical protein
MRSLKMQKKPNISPFDLEQAIMAAWGTKEDLELFVKQLVDGPRQMTEDEIWNMVYGIACLHNARSEAVFELYEQYIARVRDEYTDLLEGAIEAAMTAGLGPIADANPVDFRTLIANKIRSLDKYATYRLWRDYEESS